MNVMKEEVYTHTNPEQEAQHAIQRWERAGNGQSP